MIECTHPHPPPGRYTVVRLHPGARGFVYIMARCIVAAKYCRAAGRRSRLYIKVENTTSGSICRCTCTERLVSHALGCNRTTVYPYTVMTVRKPPPVFVVSSCTNVYARDPELVRLFEYSRARDVTKTLTN